MMYTFSALYTLNNKQMKNNRAQIAVFRSLEFETPAHALCISPSTDPRNARQVPRYLLLSHQLRY